MGCQKVKSCSEYMSHLSRSTHPQDMTPVPRRVYLRNPGSRNLQTQRRAGSSHLILSTEVQRRMAPITAKSQTRMLNR